VLTYVVKRLLIMIPTFLGVSLMIWLVMTMAPGEPTGGEGQQFGGDSSSKMKNRDRVNRSARMFREQFALNRPRFANGWTSLTPDEVWSAIRVVREGSRVHGAANLRRASRKLEDWGDYAVPPLIELLKTKHGVDQDDALHFLKQSAFRFKPIWRSGYQPTSAEVEEVRQIELGNVRLQSKTMNWKPDASASERAVAVAAWEKWQKDETAAGRWSYLDSGWERFKIRFTDTQFGKYWGNLLQVPPDLGLSFQKKEPVLDIIIHKLKYSLSLAVPSFVLAWLLAVFLGVTSAAKHNSLLDQGIGVGLFMLYSIPSFLMATILQSGVAVDLGWFPTSKFESTGSEAFNTWRHFLDVLEHLALPLFCYTYGGLAYISRQARSGMLEVLKSDFVRTARAKGLKESTVLWKHAVRNGMMPLITLLGTALPVLLAGSVVIEYIFQIPGFGQLMINSIFNKDYNVVMGVSLISAMLTLVGLLIADILYAAVDPRVSFE